MKTVYEQFNKQPFLLFDSQTMPMNADNHLAHFALTDALIRYAGDNQQPLIHFWQTAPLVILGMMDTKVSNFHAALEVFDRAGHDYVIRNSGGLAIVSDPGILNVSLIYPSPANSRLSIDKAYDLMLEFVRTTFYPAFPTKEIAAFEISHSYCFGDYDLSIDHQKIAGIAQRRIQNGVAIMIYLSVNGLQEKRAELLQEFYAQGLDGSEPAGRYPTIKPEVMTTLAAAYETKLTNEHVKKMMLQTIDWTAGEYHPDIMAHYETALAKMYQRNQRFLGENYVKNNLI